MANFKRWWQSRTIRFALSKIVIGGILIFIPDQEKVGVGLVAIGFADLGIRLDTNFPVKL